MRKSLNERRPTGPNAKKNAKSPVLTGLQPPNTGLNNSHATRFPPGESGNPKGRPKGSLNRSTIIARAILEANASRLFDKVVDMALAGSPTALKICADRLLPRPHGSPIKLALDTKHSTSEDIFRSLSAVLRAVVSGEITPQDGQNLSAIVNARRRAWESMELDERVSEIEDCAHAHRNHPGPKVTWVDRDRDDRSDNRTDPDDRDVDQHENDREADEDNQDDTEAPL